MVAMWLIAAYEWLHYVKWLRVAPWAVTSCAMAVTIWFVLKWRRIMPLARQLYLGSQGEQVVGEILDELRSWDYQVFHDIGEPNYNIDHVPVGPGGIFAVETKTISKRVGAKVTYDGQRVRWMARSWTVIQ